MARANPHLRSLRIFDPDVDLAIDDEPIKGKQSAKTSEDFMSDPLLSLAEESASSEDSADFTETTGPGKAKSDASSSRSAPPPKGVRQAEAAQSAQPAPSAQADGSFDEDLGGKVVEL